MMIEEEKIGGIIQNKLEGTLTPDETMRLNEWLEVSANADMFAQYEQIWTGTTTIARKQESFSSNTSKSWKSIEHLIVADKPKRKFKIAYGAAAALALVLMVFGANYLFNLNSSNGDIQYVLEANKKDTLTFSDGSVAYLFGPCTLTYPQEFSKDKRVLSMDGFVYFDIAHDITRPFEINTYNGMVEVLGTSFTVDTRQNKTCTVQCLTGMVRVTGFNNGSTCESILTKNKMATYTGDAKEIVVTSFDKKDLSIAIPVRNMTFSNKPLGEIIERIEYDYGVTIQLENKNLLDTKYSTSLNDTTIDDFLNELKVTFKVEVVQSNSSNYLLKGGIRTRYCQ